MYDWSPQDRNVAGLSFGTGKIEILYYEGCVLWACLAHVAASKHMVIGNVLKGGNNHMVLMGYAGNICNQKMGLMALA